MLCTATSQLLSRLLLPNKPVLVFDLQRFADGEKTEEPTSKKRSDAAKKGQVAKSQELNTAFVLLVGFFILKLLWESIYGNIADYTVYTFSHLMRSMDTEFVIELFIGIILIFFKTALPIMLAIMVVGLAINFYQVGLLFNTEKLEPKLSNLNPISGFGRIFSKRSLMELVKSLMKIAIIGGDQKWQLTQDLKMTKQEVKDEFKQMEGDPQIKGKIKQKQREMAMMRMMQEVPKADVIVTNPTHYAIALQYEQGMTAPVVIAKGQDLVALRIKEIARESRVPIVENKPLARALFATVEVGGSVPQELYKAVAEVLAYVYRLKRNYA